MSLFLPPACRGRVRLILSSRCENDQVVIKIHDNGIGISIERQGHIFERFYRVKPYPENNKKGKGLGLAIAVNIINLHNGQIRLSSLPVENISIIICQMKINGGDLILSGFSWNILSKYFASQKNDYMILTWNSGTMNS
mgnify:FL=1